jgi:hypothetical protein
MLKFSLAAAFIGLALAPAQARHRHLVTAAFGAPACVAVQEIPPAIYPWPDWEPFFRRHLYVSRVVTCIPVAAPMAVASEHVISVRY